MIEIIIDGKKISTEENRTILDVAKEHGFHIPTLCHHPILRSGFASCRLCAVEITGIKRLLPACVTNITKNMEIFTKSAAVIKARKVLIEMLLLHHPCDCLTCDKSGECELQNLAYEYEVLDNPYKNFKGDDRKFTIDLDSPVIERNMYRCITCGRCVRVCDEVRGVGAIDYVRRGFDTEINTPQGSKLRCEFCGSCVAMCPVGAVTSKSFKYKARCWELKKVKTTCGYCGTGCQLDLNVKDNVIYRVTSSSKYKVNEGQLCIRGRYGFDFVHHDSRLKEPLIRKDEKLTSATWDESFAKAAKELDRIREQYGVQSIAGIGSVRTTNEDNYVFQKFLRAAIGTHNVDTTAHYYHLPIVKSMLNSLKFPAATNSLEEILGAKVILVLGIDIAEMNPIVGLKIKKATRFQDAKLIVISPRADKLALFAEKFSGTHIENKHGTEGILLAGICNYLIKENKINKEFVDADKIQFEIFMKSISKWTPELASGTAGITLEELKNIAEAFANTDKGMIVFGNEIAIGKNGESNVSMVNNLALITGNIGRANAGVIPVTEYNNLQGAYDMGLSPAYLPGYQNPHEASVKEKFNKLWSVYISDEKGLNLSEIVSAILEGKIKALYIMGDNLVLPYLKRRHKEALDMLELIIVQDIYLTESAELATIVFPACSFAEKNGTFTNTDRHVQKVNQAIERVGLSKPDWEIIANLSQEMGYAMEFANEKEIMSEIAEVNPLYKNIQNIDLDKNTVQWPLDQKTLTKEDINKSAHFQKVVLELHSQNADNQLTLITGGTLYHSGTGTISSKSHDIMRVGGEPLLHINFADAKKLNIKNDEKVIIKTPFDKVEITASINNEVPKGSVFLPFHYVVNTNLLGNFLESNNKVYFNDICPVIINKLNKDKE